MHMAEKPNPHPYQRPFWGSTYMSILRTRDANVDFRWAKKSVGKRPRTGRHQIHSETFEINSGGGIFDWQTMSESFFGICECGCVQVSGRVSLVLRISWHEFQRPTKDSGLSPSCTGASPRVVWIVAGGKEGKVEVSAIGTPEHLS